jgi:hypothetical protein
MSKDKRSKSTPERDDSILTEFDEETGEWEVVGHDDEERFDAETDAMLRRLGITGPGPKPPHAG